MGTLLIIYLVIGLCGAGVYVKYTTKTFNHNNLDAKAIWDRNILKIIFGWPALFFSKNFIEY